MSASQSSVKSTGVDARESTHVMQVAPPFIELLAPFGVRFKQDRIESVAPESSETASALSSSSSAGTVTLQGGEQLSFDYLVVAMGGVINMGVPSAASSYIQCPCSP